MSRNSVSALTLETERFVLTMHYHPRYRFSENAHSTAFAIEEVESNAQIISDEVLVVLVFY